ncbi:MAG: restriction endonuclease subunit S [bacterium]
MNIANKHQMDNSHGHVGIDRIPQGWTVVQLGSYVDIFSGYAFKRQDFLSNKQNGVPIIKIGNLQNGQVSVDENTDYVTNDFYDKLSDFQLRYGDVLIALSGATTGKIGVVSRDIGLVLVNQRVGKFKILNSEKITKKFFYYFAQSHKFRNFIIKNIGQSAQGNLSPLQIKNALIPLPSFPEQRKIAEILSTVDVAIEKVDKAIDKTERLKKGLMQELLTKGIGHKEFKDTEIGRIPKEWEVLNLGDIRIAEIRSSKRFNGFDKVVFIPMEFISDSDILVRFEMRPIEKVKSYTYCESGDLLFAKITPSLENGKQGIVPEDIPNSFALATTEVIPIMCKGIDKFFLFYILKFNKYRNRIIASMTGTTGRQRASKESIERLQIPLPTETEQQKIVGILNSLNQQLLVYNQKRTSFTRIKKALMNDLLTGNKRVKI